MCNESEMKRYGRGIKGYNKIPKALQAGRIKTPALVAPFEQINDDVRRIKKTPIRKMSATSLKYLKDAKVISGDQYAVYMASQEEPELRKSISEFNTIEHINLKLLQLYEKV